MIRGAILPLEDLKDIVSEEEWLQSQRFESLNRRCEWLSWRSHLRQNLLQSPFEGIRDFEIEYNKMGAPKIVGAPNIYIGVSHTRDRVAVVLSTKQCAIDIELLSRNFERVRSRYISDRESQIVDNVEYGLAISWCAKEMAYKFAGVEGLDFIRDIEILSIDKTPEIVKVRVLEKILISHYNTDTESVMTIIWDSQIKNSLKKIAY